jgi:hypothetical protein
VIEGLSKPLEYQLGFSSVVFRVKYLLGRLHGLGSASEVFRRPAPSFEMQLGSEEEVGNGHFRQIFPHSDRPKKREYRILVHLGGQCCEENIANDGLQLRRRGVVLQGSGDQFPPLPRIRKVLLKRAILFGGYCLFPSLQERPTTFEVSLCSITSALDSDRPNSHVLTFTRF